MSWHSSHVLALFPFLLMASTATDNGWAGVEEFRAKATILAPRDGGSYRPHQSLIPSVLIETDGAHPTRIFLRLALDTNKVQNPLSSCS